MATKTKQSESAQAKRYFIVNPAGALHEVSKERAIEMLRWYPGSRMATPGEIAKWEAYVEENKKSKNSHKGSRAFGPVAEAWEPEQEVEAEFEKMAEKAAIE